MQEAAETILSRGRTREVESLCAPTDEIFEYVGLDRIARHDAGSPPTEAEE